MNTFLDRNQRSRSMLVYRTLSLLACRGSCQNDSYSRSYPILVVSTLSQHIFFAFSLAVESFPFVFHPAGNPDMSRSSTSPAQGELLPTEQVGGGRRAVFWVATFVAVQPRTPSARLKQFFTCRGSCQNG